MDLAIILSVVQTILTSFQTLDKIKVMFSYSDVEGELADLQNTINYVNSVLEDAEHRQGALSCQEKNYIEELKGAVYDADDLLDEFVTLLKQKQAIDDSVVEAEFQDLQNTVNNFKSVLEDAESYQNVVSTQEKHYMEEFDEFVTLIKQSGVSFLSQVKSSLFSFINYTDCMFDNIKKVNDKFGEIASKYSKFCLKVDIKPRKSINRESSSFVSLNDPIIGRGEDLEKIVEMLLDSGDDYQPNNVTSLAIVGMGGLGKTALAQFVFHDPRIKSAFPMKIWTCIGDHNQEEWNWTEFFLKVARDLLKGTRIDEKTSLERIIDLVKTHLEGKKYLLVLDDVWTEKRHEWQELEKHLTVGKSGSRIVVTTRSKKTAEIIGGIRVHELQGLGEDDSWHLFTIEANPNVYEVQHVYSSQLTFVVHLDKSTCTCRYWYVNGIPCEHAITAICSKNENPENYVAYWYSKEAYERSYAEGLEPLNGQSMWKKVIGSEILPSDPRVKYGRPPNKRKRAYGDGGRKTSTYRVQKSGKQLCSKCKKPGHKNRTCTFTEDADQGRHEQ